MNKKARAKLEEIRRSGVVNMFDMATVQSIAQQKNMKELYEYIQENPNGYTNMILFGTDKLSCK